jgi:hypothetical protein
MAVVRSGSPEVRGRRVGVMVVAALVVLVGAGACSAGSTSASSGAANEAAAPASPLAAPAESPTDAGAPAAGSGAKSDSPSFKTDALGASVTQPTGSFISTATMTVEVTDVAAVKPKVVAVAQEEGGALFGEETSLAGRSRSTITLKVPPASFNRVLERLAALGTLANQQVKTDDVTQKVIDLDARIAASSASLDRVRGLLGDAKSITDIAYLEGEVTRRQADLESLRGQKKTLQGRIDLATVAVTLDGGTLDATPAERERRRDAEPTPPTFLGGLSAGWAAAVALTNVTLAVVGALLPFLPLLVIVVLVVRWVRRRRRARPSGSGPSRPPTGDRPPPPPPSPDRPDAPAPSEPRQPVGSPS